MTKDISSEKALIGRVIEVSSIGPSLGEQMYELMLQFYHCDKTAFFNDLNAKSHAIILTDKTGELRGFTSMVFFDLKLSDKKVKVLFSGDTIIHTDFWGSLELPRVWGQFMWQAVLDNPDSMLYWFLISSGYRTYRFLPAYFIDFYPRHDAETPDEMQKVLDAAASKMFPESYLADRGIIRLDNPTPLRAHTGLGHPEKHNNPHVSFFLAKNPTCDKGDELACITRLHHDNFKPFVKRLLKIE